MYKDVVFFVGLLFSVKYFGVGSLECAGLGICSLVF